MKTRIIAQIAAVLLAPLIGLAGTVEARFENIHDYTDFSVYGLTEEKTLRIFKAEMKEELERMGEKYLADGETLVLTFTDIDMAGDIQPWRNYTNADIRYIEDIYPPRLKFSYKLMNAENEVLDEGQASISDLAFQMNPIAPVRSQYEHFFYETSLLRDWMRKTFRDRGSKSKGE